MNKIKSLTEILVSLYLVRLLLTGASIGDALVMLGLSGLYAFYMHLETKNVPEANQDLKDRIDAVEKLAESANSKISVMSIRR